MKYHLFIGASLLLLCSTLNAKIETLNRAVYFPTNVDVVATLDPTLEEIIKKVKEYGHAEIFLDGYADPRGTNAYNQNLSKRRAENVKQYLISHGINEALLVHDKNINHYKSAN